MPLCNAPKGIRIDGLERIVRLGSCKLKSYVNAVRLTKPGRMFFAYFNDVRKRTALIDAAYLSEVYFLCSKQPFDFLPRHPELELFGIRSADRIVTSLMFLLCSLPPSASAECDK